MNDLVARLSAKKHPVEVKRPFKTSDSLKASIERNYVHILFKETGTELGTTLDKKRCKLELADFNLPKGVVHLQGGLILNYQKIKVEADINLETLEGTGTVTPLTDEDYRNLLA